MESYQSDLSKNTIPNCAIDLTCGFIFSGSCECRADATPLHFRLRVVDQMGRVHLCSANDASGSVPLVVTSLGRYHCPVGLV